ncbi:transglycosylase family protein [Dermacoccaceae bacterium W4C1]
MTPMTWDWSLPESARGGNTKGRTLQINRKARMTTLVATGAAAAAAVSFGTAETAHADVWDRLAQCESGGNWNINTGNGFHGGLQFTPSTWRAYGGSGSAHNASKAEQVRVAKNVLKGQGPGAWPVCSKRAGLTRSNGGSSAGTVETTSRSAERKTVSTPKTETKKTYTKKSYSAPKTETKTSVKKSYSAPKTETKTYTKKSVVKSTAPAAVKASGDTITVKSGDTLAKLAEAHGVDSWRQLWAANTKTVSNPNLIFVGQTLSLPA